MLLRRTLQNLGLFLVALVFAIIVWFVAVGEENPLEQRVFPRLFLVNVAGLSDDMFLVESIDTEVTVTLRAPRTVWTGLTSNLLHVGIDVTGLEPGEHIVPIVATVDQDDAEVVGIAPSEVRVVLERIITRTVPITVDVVGDPAPGYEAQTPLLSDEQVQITGPSPQVNLVESVAVSVNLTDKRETIERTFTLRATDAAGQTVAGLTFAPSTIQATVVLEQLESYRDVAVRATIEGEVAAGYRVTNIAITPSVVTVFSSNPNLVTVLPGFVETDTLDISDASDDVEARLTLPLPEGVSLVGEQAVLVQVSIAAIESSVTLQHEIKFTGLDPGLKAMPSPDMVELILSGPVPVLDALDPQDVTVLVDVLGLDVGTYQIAPDVIIAPQNVEVQSVLPSIVQVAVEIDDSTPTPTIDPNATPVGTLVTTVTASSVDAAATPTVTGTPTPTRTPTPTPG